MYCLFNSTLLMSFFPLSHALKLLLSDNMIIKKEAARCFFFFGGVGGGDLSTLYMYISSLECVIV